MEFHPFWQFSFFFRPIRLSHSVHDTRNVAWALATNTRYVFFVDIRNERAKIGNVLYILVT